jgi:hypothetical protein
MFEPVLDSLKKATETTMQMQQEMFKKWAALWPGVPASAPAWGDQAQKFQKKWSEFIEETLKKQRESLEAQFAAGRRNLESALKMGQAKDVEELRAKTLEMWQQSFDTMRQLFEAQISEFQAAVAKWTELMTKGAA